MTDRLTVVSTDCHAGLPIAQYKPYVDSKYHDFIDMAVDIQIEMMDKAEQQFLIKEINDEWRAPIQQELTGAWDYKERHKMLAKDGIAAEIISPMASPNRTRLPSAQVWDCRLKMRFLNSSGRVRWHITVGCQSSLPTIRSATSVLHRFRSYLMSTKLWKPFVGARKMASKASCYPPCGASTRPITT